MDSAEAAFLVSPRGRDLLAAARELRALDPLARRTRLDMHARPHEARAALAQDALRARAARKTPLADRLLFTREALEQGSPARVADERAARFAPYATVADLGAGIGLDTIALAQAGRRVVAVERDPVRAALLAHNVAAAGLADRVTIVEGDALADPPAADAAFLDPDRRPGDRRTREAAEFEPAPGGWSDLAARYAALLVKLAPGAQPDDEGPPFEWVSLDGEMKEARAGFGAFARPDRRRRALLLPQGTVVEGEGVDWPPTRAVRVGDWILDPDPAIVLARLVGDAARSIGAAPVHRADRIPRRRRARRLRDLAPRGCDHLDRCGRTPRDRRRARRRPRRGALRGASRTAPTSGGGGSDRVGSRPAAVLVTRGADDRYLSFWSFASGDSGLTRGGIAVRPGLMP